MTINGIKAETFGVAMGDGFLNELKAPAPLKEFISNDCRLIDGKEVIHNNPKKEAREVTLIFNIEGGNPDEFNKNYNRFLELLYKGKITIGILGETYELTYLRSAQFAMNWSRTFSKVGVKLLQHKY